MENADNKNIPKGVKFLNVIWVFTIKDNGIYKVRLVLRVLRQIKIVYYTCTYSTSIVMDRFILTITIT